MNEALDAERARLKLDLIQARERVRELEAELAECQETLRDTQGWSKRHTAMATEATARAEKAETLVTDAKKVLANLRSQVLVLMSEKRRAEARVAELEAELANPSRNELIDTLNQRCARLQARVAELEMFVRGLYNCYNGPVEDRTRRMDHIFAASGVKSGRSAEVVGWGVEAREREADE